MKNIMHCITIALKQIEQCHAAQKLCYSKMNFCQIDYRRDSEDRPKDMAVRGEKVEASDKLSAILLLSIIATLCLSTSLFVLFVP